MTVPTAAMTTNEYKNRIEEFEALRESLLARDEVTGVGIRPTPDPDDSPENLAILILVDNADEALRQELKAEVDRVFGVEPEIRQATLSARRKAGGDFTLANDLETVLEDFQWTDWGSVHAKNVAFKNVAPDADPTLGGRLSLSQQGNLAVLHDPEGLLLAPIGTTGTSWDFLWAYRLLRTRYGDHYDFVKFLIDVASFAGSKPITGAGAGWRPSIPVNSHLATPLHNDVSGIGLRELRRPDYWNSERLRCLILHCCDPSRYSRRNLLHEQGHLWSAYVNYRETENGNAVRLLHEGFARGILSSDQAMHWGGWVDNGLSCMDYDRATWLDAGAAPAQPGSRAFTRKALSDADPRFGYWALDLYLMGLIPPEDVPDWTILTNPMPKPRPPDPFNAGGLTRHNVQAGNIKTVGVRNIEWLEGKRTPGYLDSQRIFHQATVVITRDLTETFRKVAPRVVEVNRAAFREATGGRALLDVSLKDDGYEGLHFRRNEADRGEQACAGACDQSPDLWVRARDDGLSGMQQPAAGQDSWIHVRVRNRGAAAYEAVTVNVYLADRDNPALKDQLDSDFRYPVDWRPDRLVGSATITRVPPDADAADGVVASIPWPASGPRADAFRRPALLSEIIPVEVRPAGLHKISDNRKLAQRNIDFGEF